MRFRVKAIQATGTGGIVNLTLDATDSAAAYRVATEQGLRVLSLKPVRWNLFEWRSGARGERIPILLFSQELATLLKAGLPLLDSIESLAEKESSADTRAVLKSLTRLLYEGKSFSQALAGTPGVFPELFIALIQAGERTGALDDALTRYIAYRSRLDMLRQKIVGASVYPLLLLVVGGGVLVFLLGYVVPRFSVIFADMGNDLPWLSRVLLEVGRSMHAHQGALAMIAIAFALVGITAFRVPESRARINGLIGRIPLVAGRIQIFQLSRLYRSVGILLQAGIPVVTALAMVRGLLAADAQKRLDKVVDQVRAGQPLSRSLDEQQLATPVAMRLLRAGEQAGNLGQMMERTADFYDEDTNRWVEWFMRLFEPILMVLVGGMIGIVVILMYIPIFELASGIR
jgi:general secretion pathway protein F